MTLKTRASRLPLGWYSTDISAKVAVSSDYLLRSTPFRRRASHYRPALLDSSSDAQTNRFMMLSGMTQILGEVEPANHAHWGARDDMQLMAVSTYRAPAMILDLIMNPDHRHFFQRIHSGVLEDLQGDHTEGGVEIYASEKDFLISAGESGRISPYEIKIAGKGNSDDQGVSIPTALIPTDHGTDLNNFIRIQGIDGDPTLAGRPGPYEPSRGRVNTCVAPGFACGINPIISAGVHGHE